MVYGKTKQKKTQFYAKLVRKLVALFCVVIKHIEYNLNHYYKVTENLRNSCAKKNLQYALQLMWCMCGAPIAP